MSPAETRRPGRPRPLPRLRRRIRLGLLLLPQRLPRASLRRNLQTRVPRLPASPRRRTTMMSWVGRIRSRRRRQRQRWRRMLPRHRRLRRNLRLTRIRLETTRHRTRRKRHRRWIDGGSSWRGVAGVGCVSADRRTASADSMESVSVAGVPPVLFVANFQAQIGDVDHRYRPLPHAVGGFHCPA